MKVCPYFFYTTKSMHVITSVFNPLNTKLHPICHLLALLGAHHIFHLHRIRIKFAKKMQRFAIL
jgi:hypothetical protein